MWGGFLMLSAQKEVFHGYWHRKEIGELSSKWFSLLHLFSLSLEKGINQCLLSLSLLAFYELESKINSILALANSQSTRMINLNSKLMVMRESTQNHLVVAIHG